jgi:hypothetical protein
MKITLNAGSCAMLDAFEPIILPNEVEIEFNSSHYKLNTLAITAKNGDIKERFVLDKAPYKIALKEVVKAGRIELEISNVIAGEVVKSWRVPDIILKEINHQFEVIPEIEELKTEIAKVKQGIAEIFNMI